jgi:hypothetical protein
LGDENTKFFHTIVTKNDRRNIITSVTAPDGNEIFNHEHKAAIIWNSYKERIGITENPIMHFSLPQIVQSHDLSHLDEPFTMEEIEAVVREMPTDRAPGPDGFNGIFMKKCWATIKGDFVKMVNDFYEENIQLDCINTEHITLITKKQ